MNKIEPRHLAKARHWARGKWGDTFSGYPVEIEAYAQALADTEREIIEGLRAAADDAESEDAYDALSNFADTLEPLE